ncbi:MAG: glutamine-synthetase adenylyltransferase [Rhodobacteraceae bacterium]|nr:glutamine-synthetase adenylyltransferase [Paracoccaceae bacterium]
MTFAARITRMPLPFSPDQGDEALAYLPDLPPELKELIRGAAGCSPYLGELTRKEATWLQEVLVGSPEDALESALVMDGENDSALRVSLRQAKRRVALLTGLADLAGVWSLEEVTGALTRLADQATQKALCFQIGAEIRRGKLPGQGEEDIDNAGGAVALAMGKMGAFELNYSSDIDLIMLFDENRFDRDDFHDARAAFIRATRRMVSMLSELTAEGYVFRTDLRLRPDPAVTPVCVSMEAAERYYESLGRTWERAAMIKARPAAGDMEAGAGYLERLRPFIWRKHLDFAAIQDAHDIRLRIREHKALGGRIKLQGHDLKLGRGGIREIEFFTQTRQLIAGGRDESLRGRETVKSLIALAAKEWVPVEVADTLGQHYRFLRECEHRVQMIRDAQTHKLPGDDDGFRRLAMMMGTGVAALEDKLFGVLGEVHELTEGFFAPEDRDRSAPEISAEDKEIIGRWRAYQAMRSTRAHAIFERLKPDLLHRLGAAARPREALLAFDGFLQGLPAGVQLFSLFEANPQLIDLIVDIAATAPDLARFLGRNAGVLDAVIGGDFFSDWPGETALGEDLQKRLKTAPDYEAALDTARRWMKEWHFRIGVHHLRGLVDATSAGRHYADLAGAVVSSLWPIVVEQFAAKHGVPPGKGAVVIGMGSLGARLLNARSDLDLIVIYDPDGHEMSDGRRPIATRLYYARLTQAFVTALTAPMAEGRLYEVDMRLRPSGRQGPVATSLESFAAYQRDEAWTWEHLALTRARILAGPAGVASAVEAVRGEVLGRGRDESAMLADVRDMRARIAAAKEALGPFDAKLGPGRMQDVELVAQAAVLLSPLNPRTTEDGIKAGADIGWFSADEASTLAAAYGLFWQVQAAAKLLSDQPVEVDQLGLGGLEFLLREAGVENAGALAQAMDEKAMAAAKVIDAVLGRDIKDLRHE